MYLAKLHSTLTFPCLTPFPLWYFLWYLRTWDDMPVIARVKAVMGSHNHKPSDFHIDNHWITFCNRKLCAKILHEIFFRKEARKRRWNQSIIL